ncbi:Hsp90 co-chaperone-like protein Cdc37 [Pleomassaria siparia CBS 279.74]|uniref:Hsp90 chaperone protein kinase-targeting subunit n=1 Tax=Pleomassaria siparia CBS 279.74 TaxID=1314801 RepID=A0A6G1KSZ7_9PLEO|nr:Hsp90 co-chaperone-like protein Cdc37 [Pleomassaria siparia CBS 279.74]
MVINYSKWDALELSDDSDIEVHPNVDKKSFIRAKQAQIHQNRDQRKHQIKTLKYEKIINDGLSERMGKLISTLQSHKDKAETEDGDAKADAQVFQSLMAGMMESGPEDRPPPPPEGVHAHIKDKPSYPQMMASLVDQVKKEVDEDKSTSTRLEKFITGLKSHKARVDGLQQELYAKLAELEKEDKKHITSDDIHTGFDYSNVKKADEPLPSSSKPVPKSTSKSPEPELLNPPRPNPHRTDTGQSSGADADIEEGTTLTLTNDPLDNDDDMEATPLAKKFAKIKLGDYSACLAFISSNPQILAEKETDGLLVEAFNSALEHKPKHAKQCVHQALLIQYCRQLGGREGVSLFFKRIQTKGHQAQKIFVDDVDATYRRIATRAAEILKERAENPEAGGVEQIQLHAVDPNTSINITVPLADSEDPDEQASRQMFDTFPPGLQRALESGKLDEVNKVLAKMSVEEAEEIVAKLGEGGMLSLEEGVIDATTDEGKKVMEQIEKTGQLPGQIPGEEEVKVILEEPSVDQVD